MNRLKKMVTGAVAGALQVLPQILLIRNREVLQTTLKQTVTKDMRTSRAGFGIRDIVTTTTRMETT